MSRAHIFSVLPVLAALHLSWAELPAITGQPRSQSLSLGDTMELSVGVTGRFISYRWFQSGAPIDDSNTNRLVRDPVKVTDSGSYWVEVRNLEGVDVSEIARVEVNNPAAVVTPIILRGWNSDMVLEAGGSSELEDFDGAGGFWFESGLFGRADGLPATRQLTSLSNVTVRFALEPYNRANALRLNSSNPSGRLTLEVPTRYLKLSILAASGSGGGIGQLRLLFDDGTASDSIQFNAYDWFSRKFAVAIGGLSVLRLSDDNLAIENETLGYGMFSSDIDLEARGLEEKRIREIEFIKPEKGIKTAIFAVSGMVNKGAPRILQPPLSSTVSKGTDIRLGVVVAGDAPFAYQWYSDGKVLVDGEGISGSQSSELLMLSAQPSQSGFYSVVVSNAAGSVTSAAVEISILDLDYVPGTERWLFTPVDRQASVPALDTDGTVYATDLHALYALDSSGNEKWRNHLGEYILTSPSLGKDMIYLGGRLPVDGAIFAIKKDGTLAWKASARGPVIRPPSIALDGTIYYGSLDGSLAALTSGGDEVWRLPIGDRAPSEIAIGEDGTLYIGSGELSSRTGQHIGTLYAVLPDGRLKWSHTALGPFGGIAIGDDGTVYASGSGAGLAVYAFTPQGDLKWKRENFGWTGACVGTDGNIYTGREAFDSEGNLLWQTEFWSKSGPAISADGLIYTVGKDDVLRALNAAGVVVWELRGLFQSRHSEPVIGPDGTIYFGSFPSVVAVHGIGGPAASSWPMYQHDPRRSGSVQSSPSVPLAALTQPAEDSQFLPQARVKLVAELLSTNVPARIEFFANDELLGFDESSPYEQWWEPSASGAYGLYVVALSGNGDRVASAKTKVVVNVPPEISLLAPDNGATFSELSDILLEAEVSDSDGIVEEVHFLSGEELIAIVPLPGPYRVRWERVAAGTHLLSAKARDNLGAWTISPAVSVRINAAPTVRWLNPPHGAQFVEGQSIELSVEAADKDDEVGRVEFYDGAMRMGIDAEAPYALDVEAVSPGSHSFYAVAFDQFGAAARSPAAAVEVIPTNKAPAIALHEPFEGEAFLSGENISARALVGDPEGILTAVHFRVNQEIIASADSASLASGEVNFLWSGAKPGRHELAIVASDGAGLTSSRAVNITVTASLQGPVRTVSQEPHPAYWITDGDVHALVEHKGTLYIGGEFNHVGQAISGTAILDLSAESLDLSFPMVDGHIDAIADDGMGGFYIGGSFKKVGSVQRQNVAHIRADGSVNTDFKAEIGGRVMALAIAREHLYLGGFFQEVNDVPRRFLAAVRQDTGASTEWNPGPNNSVQALAVAGSQLVVGGEFSAIGNVDKSYLAAIDLQTGSVTDWAPPVTGPVIQLLVANERLYVVGNFNRIDDFLRNGLAALDIQTGALTEFNRYAEGDVRWMAVDGEVAYLGGSFRRAGGKTRNYLAAVDAITGDALSWAPEVNEPIRRVATDGDVLYIAGQFTEVNGQTRSRFAAFDLESGELTELNLNAEAGIAAMGKVGERLLGAGRLGSIQVARTGAAAIDVKTGLATRWNPKLDGPVYALAADETQLFLAGGFGRVQGQVRHGIASVDLANGMVNSWTAGAAGGIRALAVADHTLFVGGAFGEIAGQRRASLAALDTRTALALPWNPGADGLVTSLRVLGSSIYVTGLFKNIAQEKRQYVAELNRFTGVATAWDPNPDTPVAVLEFSGGIIYAGGAFTEIGGKRRLGLAALDPEIGFALGWTCDADGSVLALRRHGDLLYAAGQFRGIGSASRSNAAVLDARRSDTVLEWDPAITSTLGSSVVYEMLLHSEGLLVGGRFNSVGGARILNLAAFPAPEKISAPLISSDNIFRMSFSAPLGRMYVFEASTNLVDWTPVLTNQAPLLFEDVEAFRFPHRFYRAVPIQ